MKKIVFMMCLAALVLSCSYEPTGEKAPEATEKVMANEIRNTAQLPAPDRDVYAQGGSKLIKSVNYRFQVHDVKKSTEAIEAAIRKYPAYISASSMTLQHPRLENKLTIRVQSEYFNELLQEIDKQAMFVNFRDVTTEDVSKQFVDLESRLKTKREVEERYMTILRNKAGTIEELLDAEAKIGYLHEEIEATVSRINYLREQVKYSTLNLEYYQTVTAVIASDEEPVGDKFQKALNAGMQLLIHMALAIVYIWPLLVLAGGVWFVIRYKKKKPAAVKSVA